MGFLFSKWWYLIQLENHSDSPSHRWLCGRSWVVSPFGTQPLSSVLETCWKICSRLERLSWLVEDEWWQSLYLKEITLQDFASILVKYLCVLFMSILATSFSLVCSYLYVFDIAFWRRLASSGGYLMNRLRWTGYYLNRNGLVQAQNYDLRNVSLNRKNQHSITLLTNALR